MGLKKTQTFNNSSWLCEWNFSGTEECELSLKRLKSTAVKHHVRYNEVFRDCRKCSHLNVGMEHLVSLSVIATLNFKTRRPIQTLSVNRFSAVYSVDRHFLLHLWIIKHQRILTKTNILKAPKNLLNDCRTHSFPSLQYSWNSFSRGKSKQRMFQFSFFRWQFKLFYLIIWICKT